MKVIDNCPSHGPRVETSRMLHTSGKILLAVVGIMAMCVAARLSSAGGQDTNSQKDARKAKPQQSKTTKGNLSGDFWSLAEVEESKNKEAIAHPEIPAASSVEKMIAEAYGHPLFPMVPDIGPFEVPPEDYEKILRCFRHAQFDERVPSRYSQEIGTMRVLLKEKAMFRICWFWVTEHGRLAFSCNGIRYRSTGERFADDETLAVDIVLRKIHERIAKAGKKDVENAPK